MRWQAAVGGIAAAALLGLVAIGSNGLPGSGPGGAAGVSVDVRALVSSLLTAALVTGGGVLLWLLWPTEEDVWSAPPRRRSLASGLLWLAGALAISVLLGSRLRLEAEPAGSEVLVPVPPTSAAEDGSLWVLLGWGAAVVLVAGALLVLRRPTLSRQVADRTGASVASPSAASDTPGGGLRDGGPRFLVEHAYADMTATLAAVGVGRATAEAPREYARRAGAAMTSVTVDVTQLTTLFEQARYDHRPVTPAQAQDAQSAARRIAGAVEDRP